MKYCHYWRKQVSKLPEILQEYSISYKAYKKLIKKDGVDIMIQKLKSDTEKADDIFKKALYHKNDITCYYTSGLSLLCKSETTVISKSELYDFCTLNSMTLYKICKKAAKHYNTPVTVDWLTTIKSNKSLSFVDGMEKKELELITQQHNQECPICLDDIEGSKFIMHCGHVLCLDCVKGMLQVSNAKGTLHNLIAYGLYTSKNKTCPICRDILAFREYKVLPG